jgi:dipeptidyl aminopeptidase/acylaminoacyl peptidase
MSQRAFGTWPSSLSAAVVARGAGRFFAGAWLDGKGLRWLEYRADEEGRGVIVGLRDGDSQPRDLSPRGFNIRTRVHEMGGGACWFAGETMFFSHFADSRLYRQDGADAEPVPLTPQPPAPHSLRYADGELAGDGRTLVCVRERHERDGVHNELVALASDGSEEPRVVAAGSDFVSSPRIDPSGARIAWLRWDFPQMPWDGTELWLGALAPDGTISEARRVAGGAAESIFQPQWSPAGRLHFCSDRSGFWNLERLGDDGTAEPLTAPEGAEIGYPAWVLGMRRYAFLDEQRIVCVVTREAGDSLALLSADGSLETLPAEWTSYDPTTLDATGERVAFAAASPGSALTLVLADLGGGARAERRVRRSLELELDPQSIAQPRPIAFRTRDGALAHAFYYPPASTNSAAPAGEPPPLRVICHGGPTGHSPPKLDLRIQYFTQRGIGVLDVNYRGSSGFGREYRRALDGRWGEIDWRDCVDAARALARQGDADPQRSWIWGGSAGGYVVLCALAFDPHAFAAGVSLCGVADVEALARDTHKFESRYLDVLIGPYPERAELYRARSPVNHVDALERPLLLLQGLEDAIVPPSQAEAMLAALVRKGVPHAYVAFADEGHGFRRAENIARALEAELEFVGRVFGFAPADALEPLDIAFLD